MDDKRVKRCMRPQNWRQLRAAGMSNRQKAGTGYPYHAYESIDFKLKL